MKQNTVDVTERVTTQAIGLRSLPNIASHCQIIIDPCTKVSIILQRHQWYQVSCFLKNKEFTGWIPIISTRSLQTDEEATIRSNVGSAIKQRDSSLNKSPSKGILKEATKTTDGSIIKDHCHKKSIVIIDLKDNKTAKTTIIFESQQNSNSRRQKLEAKKFSMNNQAYEALKAETFRKICKIREKTSMIDQRIYRAIT